MERDERETPMETDYSLLDEDDEDKTTSHRGGQRTQPQPPVPTAPPTSDRLQHGYPTTRTEAQNTQVKYFSNSTILDGVRAADSGDTDSDEVTEVTGTDQCGYNRYNFRYTAHTYKTNAGSSEPLHTAGTVPGTVENPTLQPSNAFSAQEPSVSFTGSTVYGDTGDMGPSYQRCKAARTAGLAHTSVNVTVGSDLGKTESKRHERIGNLDDSSDNLLSKTFRGSRINNKDRIVNQSISASFDPATMSCLV